MNIEALKDYLTIFSKEGYAKDPGTRNNDGSMTIRHTNEDWSTVDTYWGGEPYSGCETVLYEGKPVWSMVYYGAVDPNIDYVESVYSHLRKALSNTDASFPLRGPSEFTDGDMSYFNNWEGDVSRFSGEESINKGGTEIYSANYMGGLVNQREE